MDRKGILAQHSGESLDSAQLGGVPNKPLQMTADCYLLTRRYGPPSEWAAGVAHSWAVLKPAVVNTSDCEHRRKAATGWAGAGGSFSGTG